MKDSLNYETPNGRTYGECVQAELDSVRLINGRFVPTLCITHKPKRLSRDKALTYYTDKLKEIWASLSHT